MQILVDLNDVEWSLVHKTDAVPVRVGGLSWGRQWQTPQDAS